MAKEKHGKDPGIKVVYLRGGAQANSLGGKLETGQQIPLLQRPLHHKCVRISSQNSSNSGGMGVLLAMAVKGTGLEEGAHPPLPDSSHSLRHSSLLSYTVKELRCSTTYCKNDIWWFGYRGLSDAKRIAAWDKNWSPDTFICT